MDNRLDTEKMYPGALESHLKERLEKVQVSERQSYDPMSLNAMGSTETIKAFAYPEREVLADFERNKIAHENDTTTAEDKQKGYIGELATVRVLAQMQGCFPQLAHRIDDGLRRRDVLADFIVDGELHHVSIQSKSWLKAGGENGILPVRTKYHRGVLGIEKGKSVVAPIIYAPMNDEAYGSLMMNEEPEMDLSKSHSDTEKKMMIRYFEERVSYFRALQSGARTMKTKLEMGIAKDLPIELTSTKIDNVKSPPPSHADKVQSIVELDAFGDFVGLALGLAEVSLEGCKTLRTNEVGKTSTTGKKLILRKK
jgi:hypothetical protein